MSRALLLRQVALAYVEALRRVLDVMDDSLKPVPGETDEDLASKFLGQGWGELVSHTGELQKTLFRLFAMAYENPERALAQLKLATEEAKLVLKEPQ